MNVFARKADPGPYHHAWTRQNQDQPPETALHSPLLDLARSSDVDPLLPEQVANARHVLRLRRAVIRGGDPVDAATVLDCQRRIVERFLASRRAYFGEQQSRPLPDAAALAHEGRDIFVVVKFMDEAPHLAATLRSLVNQREIDPGRVLIVTVDNNSADGSDAIAREVATANRTAVRIVNIGQRVPGAGNAARLGVDTCIATIHDMCLADGRWDRLQRATVAVSDGDTVYHPRTVHEVARILDEDPDADGVMPFLTYKFTAALRLFHDYRPADPDSLAARAQGDAGIPVSADLSGMHAHDELPRWQRRETPDGILLTARDGRAVTVPLAHADEHQRRFGVLRDSAGRRAYIFADRTLVLHEAPVSGLDTALVTLENACIRRDEKWRWHAVVGHDLFLYWAFAGMGLPERMVFPDTSDALKTFRAWSFAIGGQHQLRRPGLRIATGSDYQSGRVLQAVGNTIRLGPAQAFAETETDRLIKMIRNFVHRQSVFYGSTRSSAMERATGLYVHMTRIQGDLERELRGYTDEVFEQTVFPERLLFPLRWILQNAVRFYCHGGREREIVRERALGVMFSHRTAVQIEHRMLSEGFLRALAEAPFTEKQAMAERVAEQIMARHHREIMAFYRQTLRSFFSSRRVPPASYEWLLSGLTESRSAITQRPPDVDVTAVWEGDEFDIDTGRGQVVRMRSCHGQSL